MSTVIAGMTMSLDGFVTDVNGSAGPLYSDFADLLDSPYMRSLQQTVGAVVMGRRTFDGAPDPDAYADGYEFQVPIFVLTHHAPAVVPRRNDRLSFTFVTDGVKSLVAQATEAAGDRAVLAIGGANLNQQLIAAGLADELWVEVMPVLLGSGQRLFSETGPLELEKIGVDEIGAARTALRFRVKGR